VREPVVVQDETSTRGTAVSGILLGDLVCQRQNRLGVPLLADAGSGPAAARVGALAWLNPLEARKLVDSNEDVPIDHPTIRQHLESVLAQLNQGRGPAKRVERLPLLSEPADIDIGEITDKGYVNRRMVLRHRAKRGRDCSRTPSKRK
jgi:hypothetical protein